MSELRYVLSALRKSPGFTGVVVLALALGIGAVTVMLSVVDHVVLRSLPYPDAGRLVAIRESIKELSNVYPTVGVNAGHYLEWQRTCNACEALGARQPADVTLTGVGDAEKLVAARVSTSLLQSLGARTQIGRVFDGYVELDRGERVVVLSHGLWRRQFTADPAVVGRSVTLNGAPWVVIGVLSPDFQPPIWRDIGGTLPDKIDVYLPLALTGSAFAWRWGPARAESRGWCSAKASGRSSRGCSSASPH